MSISRNAGIGAINKVDIYCDGCRKKTGNGGWSSIIVTEQFVKLLGGYELDTTNNKMELQGPVAGLSAITQIPARKMITSDSKYFVDGFNQWLKAWVRRNWKIKNGAPVKNQDQWKKLWDMKEREVHARWVKGHSNHRENELCDTVANICCANQISIDESFSSLEELEFYLTTFKNE